MDLRSRNSLARNKLEEFKAFCAANGWIQQPIKGDYEVLRMCHPDWKEPMIVHQRINVDSVHLTTWGNSADMLRRYFRNRKEKGNG